jgi:hypothetical protein
MIVLKVELLLLLALVDWILTIWVLMLLLRRSVGE